MLNCITSATPTAAFSVTIQVIPYSQRAAFAARYNTRDRARNGKCSIVGAVGDGYSFTTRSCGIVLVCITSASPTVASSVTIPGILYPERAAFAARLHRYGTLELATASVV